MLHEFRAVAVDYDGTIAEGDRPNPAALEALAVLRASGMKILLCTGRILDELRTVFPDVDRHFDALVVENGGVVVIDSRATAGVEPLPEELATALRERDVPFRAGSVLLATDARHDGVVLAEIARLGFEAQLIYNRQALMILPAGVSKGTGLLHALGVLEVSRHSTIGIGDAENDHSLLHTCEIGVAVSNAVPALREHADVCLNEPDGAGVATFLGDSVLRGELPLHAGRWHVELGNSTDYTPVRLPGSRINLLVAGASCSGKSYFTGLLVERLAALGYSIVVLDAEGDHAGLEQLAGVIAAGGRHPLPAPARLARLVRNRFTSVIADLSLLEPERKRAYSAAVLKELHALRAERGYPHWIVIEEADQLLFDSDLPADAPDNRFRGYCLVTHRPTGLSDEVRSSIDAVIALPGAERYARLPLTSVQGFDAVERPFLLPAGHALLATENDVRTFQVADRVLSHVRHQHKYTHAQVPLEQQFYFGGGGPVAGNVAEFRDGVSDGTDRVLHQHLTAGDFSRWSRDVLADDELGARLRAIERWFHHDPHADIEPARAAILAAVDDRYAPLNGGAPKPDEHDADTEAVTVRHGSLLGTAGTPARGGDT